MAPTKYHEGKFPPKNLNWEALVPLIGPATVALARYDGLLTAIPNAAVLLTPLTTQEAVLSSRIEGTQTTMGEVLEYEAEPAKVGVPPDKAADINEVLNYRRATWQAEEMLRELPFCGRVIREAHKVLLSGVRGHDKSPGEFRKVPNWIGPPGCTIEEARYMPISAGRLDEAMGEWEKYAHGDEKDVLVQLGVLHAEFEALHPFLDGNGRLGRMCVPLFLHYRQIIRQPMFYVSEYFERNKDEYYERLLAVSRDDAWTEWCAFFLKAIHEQAKVNQSKADAILNLYDETKKKVSGMLRSQYAIHAVDFMFRRPVFNTRDFVSDRIPKPTARVFLRKLRDEGFLAEIRAASGRRPAVLAFSDLLNTAEGKSVF